MLTSEYPYSECSNPAQIYKKATSGKLPEAFYRIQDEEARKFIGKCLENVSKRVPAHELLLDPILASNEETLQSIPRVSSQKLTHKGPVAELAASLQVDPTRNTDMSITVAMNPEDDTIFLKVHITEKEGHARNIYFPFDLVNDNAIGVASEMVKELDIDDWEPLQIADMIEEEISSLVPTWKDWCTSQVHHQHSFKYDDDNEDDDKNGISHPFCATSPQLSFLPMNHNFVWGKVSLLSAISPKCNTRLDSWRSSHFNGHRKLTKICSLVDIRSKLLHQLVMAEINKRRLFKTIGAVEDIGYREPGVVSDQAYLRDGRNGRIFRSR
ncbi:hypothetical protein V6N13_038742 [Hibiscus sabdariffa]